MPSTLYAQHIRVSEKKNGTPILPGSPYQVLLCSTIALGAAAIAALNDEPVLGVIAIVPVVQTHPGHDNPWGENACTPGLTPKRLLTDLEIAFTGVELDYRNHWHSNPWIMPDDILRKLPRVIVVSGRLDILHESQAKFVNRLQALNVEVECKMVDGLHQVKDMCQTQAGREAIKYAKLKTIEMVERAQMPLLD